MTPGDRLFGASVIEVVAEPRVSGSELTTSRDGSELSIMIGKSVPSGSTFGAKSKRIGTAMSFPSGIGGGYQLGRAATVMFNPGSVTWKGRPPILAKPG